MAIIQVTPESLRSEANRLNTLKESHKTEMNNLRRLILSLNEQWKGSAQDAFVGKYQELQPEFQKFIKLLEDHITHMKVEADQMEERDNALASTMKSFSV